MIIKPRRTKVDAYTVLYAPFIGANASIVFRDMSANNYAMTAQGSAKLSTTYSKFMQSSLALDGVGDWVEVGAIGNWNFLHNQTAKFTFDCWYKANDFTEGAPLFGTSAGSSVYVGAHCVLQPDRTISLTITFGTSGQYAMNFISAGVFPNDTTAFHHIEVDCDMTLANGNVNVYVDGTRLTGTGNKSGSYSNSNSQTTLAIGDYGSGVYPVTNAYISDVRISNIIRHSGNFTAPTRRY